ncbi:MAG TPA: hypothetical protein VIL46_09930, partial [Gemmataceae bacterium]
LEVRQGKRVWKNNKAENPKSAEGRTLRVEGVFGKFLDNLLVIKPGEGVEIETKHVKGDNLTFLGEWLQKVDLPSPGAKEKDRDRN